MSVVEAQESSGVLTVTIRREAQRNALNTEVLSGLEKVFSEWAHQESIGVVLLRGAGEKAFIAGADISEMADSTPQKLQAFIDLGQRVTRLIETFPAPVVAVVQGFALGGGLEMALACDLIIASDQARLGQPEVNLGIIPGFGGTQRLIQRCGIGAARRLVLTGEVITAAEAHRLHLVDEVRPAADLEVGVSALVDTIRAKGPRAVRAAKRVMQQYEEVALVSGLKREAESFVGLFASGQPQEGFRAFVEKRKPKFVS